MNSKNPNTDQALELKAGIFVLIGLVFIGMMAFKFGRLGQGLFQQYYPLTVTFPSADGLIKNSDVQLAGARIGYVAEKPVITTGGSGVTIALEILSNVKIPKQTAFEVESSGLMGDKFVDIKPTAAFDPGAFNPADPDQVLAPGSTVQGAPAAGLLGGLQTELSDEIKKLTVVTEKINDGILSQQNQRNLSQTLANLNTTSAHFTVVSRDLDTVAVDAKTAVDSAKVTLGTVNAAAADVHTAIDDAQKAIDTARDLLTKAQTGNGPVATLLNDPQLSDNLKAFVANLREHGVLFYKNRDAVAASPTPALRR